MIFDERKRPKLLITLSVFIGAMVFGFISLFYANIKILKNSQYIFPANQVATTTVGLIFGGGVDPEGNMSAMLADRIKTGAELLKIGKVNKLMITGDDGQFRGNEIIAMEKGLRDLGVAANRIMIDPHGYRTYESCYRFSKVYGFSSVIAVSQNFHLPRIVYLCENFGIKTMGVAADQRDYGLDTIYMNIREILARLKAVWQVEVTKPLPRMLNAN